MDPSTLRHEAEPCLAWSCMRNLRTSQLLYKVVLEFQQAALSPLCWSWADPMAQDTWHLVMLSLFLIYSHAKWPWVLLTFPLKSCFPDLQLFLQLFSSWSTFFEGGGGAGRFLKKKNSTFRINLCALSVTSQKLRKAEGSFQHPFPWEDTGFPHNRIYFMLVIVPKPFSSLVCLLPQSIQPIPPACV